MRAARNFSLFSSCLLLLVCLAGSIAPAAAQQQEKRIALVVGNGAYAKTPLATAANDAGLIAQTLQAAGFDVIGARDLDGDTLRKSFRDFIRKAEASGPGTVAMVYLAGYGVQLAGENYFVPVDSTIEHDTDIPIEGMRISDYVRQLAALPLKASVVVLDAARQQPFIEGGQPIASGLALVEPENNMLIAFNAAPGTVAPSETGPYGIYAQSLAEMIRTGGLSLPDVFDRVRLRVNDATKGAQVPWDEQKIQAQFTFFDRAPDAPPTQGAADQVAAIRDRPIRDLSVQDAYTAALERDTLQGYEDFLIAFPNDPLAKRVRAIVAARREAITWRRSYRADTPDAYWSYLRRYPRGPHAWDARRRLTILTAQLDPPPSFAMLDYDVPPPPPDEDVYVDRPVLYFGDPDFGFIPPPPPPVYFLPPPPPDFVVLAPPFVAVGLFILPQPVFVPIPVFCRPPVYVAPPPNNIIFNNIHNTTIINTVINQPPAPPAPAAPGGAPTAASAAAAAAGRPVGAGPALPAAVTQRASLIQQGKAPVPPSATIIPTARPSTPGTIPTNVTPTTTPQPSTLPKTNTLPVPGTKGAPPAPPGTPGAGPGTVNPSTRLTPSTPPPPGTPGAAPGTVNPNAKLAPSTPAPANPNLPKGANPAVVPSKPPVAQTQPAAPEVREKELREKRREPSLPPSAGKPPPPPPIEKRAAPPPQIERRAAPPPPPPRPAPPPPPPRPQVTRPPPPPPPPPRLAPPPPVARPAPPPPPRPAPPPPPRPAAPAKKCPPNVSKC